MTSPQLVAAEPFGVVRPTVSVVIPCYNYGRYLEQAVASVLDQRGLDLDVLIIDDRSTDGSEVVAQRLAEQHDAVRCIVHDVNRGHIATYNEGLSLATGTYLMLLSADDVVTRDALTRSVELLEAHPSVGLVYGYSRELFADTRPEEEARTSHTWSTWDGSAWIRECCRQGKNMINTPEAVMRTAVFRQIGGYEPDFPHAADFYMWLKAAARADVGRVNGPVQAHYRVHGQNMHVQHFPAVITDLRERRRAFARFFDTEPDLVRTSRDLPMLAARGMADEALRLAIGAASAVPPDGDEARAFADLAHDLDPAVEGSLRWRYHSWASSTRSRASTVSARFVRVFQSVQARYRWRRWRRTGL